MLLFQPLVSSQNLPPLSHKFPITEEGSGLLDKVHCVNDILCEKVDDLEKLIVHLAVVKGVSDAIEEMALIICSCDW
jgi:hypothetical protein